jgi:hypothetical protein
MLLRSGKSIIPRGPDSDLHPMFDADKYSHWNLNQALSQLDFKEEAQLRLLDVLKGAMGGEGNLKQHIVEMDRRSGKTYTIAAFAASSLLTTPGCKILVYHAGVRQSDMFLDLVVKILKERFHVQDIKVDKSCITVEVNGETRKVASEVSGGWGRQTLPGAMIICEHPGAMEYRWFADILGVMMASTTPIICIYTDCDLGPYSWFAKFAESSRLHSAGKVKEVYEGDEELDALSSMFNSVSLVSDF